MELRHYQKTAIAQVHEAIAQGFRAPLLVLPTGSGKTVIGSELIRHHMENQGRALFLAPRRELIHQASDKLKQFGIEHGVLLAGRDDLRSLYAPVQVASIDTVISRVRRRTVLPPELMGIDQIIVDEAHLSVTERRQHLLSHWPDATVIGLTATPTRKDGRALGILYDRLIEPTTTAKLTNEGYLAPARYFSVSEPDLQRVKTIAGDYHQGELEAAMNRAELVGDAVGTWLQRAADRRSIVFCCSVAHSVAMSEAFMRAGVAAEHIDGTMPTPEREGIIARFRSGETQVLTNCFVASYGFDLPEVSCIVLARPTKSLMLYLQMLGRGLRTVEGKSDCLVLDHSGCVHRHGFAADERQWTLEGKHALVERERTPKEKAEAKQIDCPECHAVYSGTRTCPECGYRIQPKGKEVVTLDGELVEIGGNLPSESQDRLAFFLELKGYAKLKGYKPGYAGVKFRERFADWPPKSWDRLPAVTPSISTQRWIQSRNIAWAKSQAKMQAGGAYR